MKIAIIGTGYVGLISGVGFASKGNDVTCVDIDKKKVDLINSGKAVIYEQGLETLLKEVLEKKFKATTDLKKAILDSEVSFICVGTPSRENGSSDLKYIEQVSRDIGTALKEKKDYHVVVVKSTVFPGTTKEKVIKLLEENSGKKAGKDFGVCMTPEFLREGMALEDFLKPDRVVLGSIDEKSKETIKPIMDFNCPIFETDLKTAEMIKYASNAFLATKISFSNEIGNICKKLGIDSYKVAEAMGLDKRIAPSFLRSGLGFGGSCFPKDVKALIAGSKSSGHDPLLIAAVLEVNKDQVDRFMYLAKKKIPAIENKKVAVLGLAFKPGTDDIREAPSLRIIEKLLEIKAKISAYDPEAMENTKKVFKDIEYCKSAQDALKDAELCLIVTEWDEFKNLDFSKMKNKVVIDGRRVVENTDGIDYEGLCW